MASRCCLIRHKNKLTLIKKKKKKKKSLAKSRQSATRHGRQLLADWRDLTQTWRAMLLADPACCVRVMARQPGQACFIEASKASRPMGAHTITFLCGLLHETNHTLPLLPKPSFVGDYEPCLPCIGTGEAGSFEGGGGGGGGIPLSLNNLAV